MATREALLQATGKPWNVRDIINREWRLIRAILVIVVLMNVPYGRYVLYPFSIFSTWVHEMCHGIAAIMMGGNITKLMIYPDGSGLAYYTYPGGTLRRAFITSGGYSGTATVGGILLLFRRTKRGPRMGICGLAATMLLSCAFFVRNGFGIAFLTAMGLVLIVLGLKLPSQRLRDLFVLLAATCSLNVITSIHNLFGNDCYINGEPSYTDAHTMSEKVFLPYWFWASVWMIYALFMTSIGFFFAIEDPNHVEEDDLHCCGADTSV